MNPEIKAKLMEELNTKIYGPYKKAYPDKSYDVREVLSYENVQELSYFSLCFNESLRIEPPVVISSNLTFT